MPRANIDHNLQPAKAQHAGLWFDKYMSKPDKKESRGRHVADTAAIAEPQVYTAFYAGWQKALQEAGAETKVAKCLGRLIVGLGNESVIETSITLHRTYGVPYIPGSALKGLAASYARQRLGDYWKEDSPAYKALFGYAPDADKSRRPAPEAETDMGAAGHVVFFDALYVPQSGLHKQALHADVMTVHHGDYYNSQKPAAPADWDDPNPVPFLTVAKGKFLVALAGPPAWVTAAFKMLAYALAEYGVGAKTNAGYGRMSLEGYETLAHLSTANAGAAQAGQPGQAAKAAPADPQQALVDDFIRRLEAMPGARVAGEMGNFVQQQWKPLNVSPAEKKRAAAAIVQKVKDAGREKASSEKAWYIEVKAVAEG